jgi:SAM-dependent methyltransferase
MTTAFAREPGDGLDDDELPGYARMLHAYHRSRAADLRAMIATLPLTPDSCVLDVASGDGCYSIWLAERARQVVGVDLSPAYLDHARWAAAASPYAARISFERCDVAALPFEDSSFDLAWCAQSLFSLPNSLTALREMIRVTRPAGHVAIFESDTLHQLLLPWPAELELAVRQAQMVTLAAEQPEGGLAKFYIGRDLCGLFRQCGVQSCTLQTFPIDIRAPLDADEELFLRLYFADLRERAWARLDSAARAAFDMLFDPRAPTYLPRRPDFHLTHLETLAIGKVMRFELPSTQTS